LWQRQAFPSGTAGSRFLHPLPPGKHKIKIGGTVPTIKTTIKVKPGHWRCCGETPL
jgi:hypothetical protein